MRSKRELSLLKRGKLDMHGHTLFEIFKNIGSDVKIVTSHFDVLTVLHLFSGSFNIYIY